MEAAENIYTPSPVQQEAHLCDADELLYGGTAGPGKTVFLKMDPFETQIYGEIDRWNAMRAAGQNFRSVGWALYLRRTFPELEQFLVELLDTAFKIDPDFHWNSDKKILTHPCGYKYQMGHLQKPEDYRSYDSSQYTWLGIDEAIQFPEYPVRMICSRVRTTDPILIRKLRKRFASNPDAPAEGLWVKERFVDPAPAGRKLLVDRIKMSDGTYEERTRMYIPARLSDNPSAEFRRRYEADLRMLPHHVMLARLEGRWDVVSDAFFAYEWKPEHHVVKPYPIPAGWPRGRVMDMGYKVACPILWYAVTPDGDIVVYREVTFNHKVKEKDRKDAELVALAIRRIEKQHGEWDERNDCSKLSGPADNQISARIGTVGPSMEESMAGHGVYWEKCTKDKVASTAEFIRRLRDIPTKPGTRPGITFFDTCTHCIRTIPLIRIDPNNQEAPLDDDNNHWLNAIQYMVMHRMAQPTEREVTDFDKRNDPWDDDDELGKLRAERGTAVGGGYFSG
jgi:hypothetical protein